jgi:NMD protein affecting ribosome stability and mRNA decay
MQPVVYTSEALLQRYLAQAEACAAQGCKVCEREAGRYRAELVQLRQRERDPGEEG